MSLSTNLVSGLASGFDWRSMIDQLMEIEHRKVDLVEDRKTEYEDKLSEWQSFNTKLLSLKTTAADLKDSDDFDVYTSDMTSDSSTVDASDLLSVSTSSSASKGSYTITVSSLATAQKLSSGSFSGFSDALGASYAGDILINGVAVSISETDTLADVRDKINNINGGTNPTGVTASIVSFSTSDYRLMLTSDNTGEDGIALQNASASDLVELFGWKDKSSSIKNSITGGAQSDSFTNSTQDVKTLLGLSSTQSGTIQIMDGNSVYQNVSIDFSTDSIEDIKTAINNASIVGVSASVITDTTGNTATYKLQIDGSQDFVDSQNLLETLGIIQNGVSDVQGSTSGNSMTVDGEYITPENYITDIDGYNQFTAGDKISLGATSRDHSNNDVSGDILTITTSTTVQDLLDAIETAYEINGDEVSAYITSTGKIEVSDLESGASSLVVDLKSTIGDSNSSLDWGAFTALGEVRKRELIAGADASIIVDGVTTTSTDNTVDDVISGVTLNLMKADIDTTVTLNIDRDFDAIMEKFSAFVDAYNEVTSYIQQQQSYDEDEEETGGVLFGDGTLSSVKSDLTSTLIQSVWGVSGEYSMMGLVGINLDNEGQLSIDTEKLQGYLKTNFNDVKNLFSASGTANSGTLEYVSHSRDTEAGEYTVNVTTAATQSTSSSNNGTVGENETLTITEDDKIAEVALTTDMTLTDIKNAINSEMSKVYTETLIGDAQLYEGSGGTTALSSTTTWDQVYIDGSNSANLADNDVISFSGTTRSGGDVDGSYTISDASTDSVQGLLSAIESAYGNGITAAVDSSGQIVLTEKNSGNSQISITFDYSQAHNLSFGSSVSTANTGGQEGRYAMDITATDDGSGHLVLTHDNYGSNYSFTISESAGASGNKLWTGGDQTVDNGVDVAGTINGEAATGSGQILTGDDGESNIDGLVIKYTGTAEGLDVGETKLTLGTAELFDRVLFSITDSYEGYVAFKQDSLQNSIDSFETRIEEMEARLDLKMENMINKFVAMETALSVMQSQSEWLTGQINASYSGWG
ncbi:MAG: flagellar filament capping protein FliD [Desulfobacterales bacterium]|jgi:flagellar hook-associated protein 2